MAPGSIAFRRVRNFRDVGGYRAADGGRVASGRLYRADLLAKFDDADWARFRQLGVRTVIDLRYPWEIAAAGRVRTDPALAYHNLSIEHRPYDQAMLGPQVAPVPYLAERFAEVLADGFAEIRAVLDIIASDGAAPVVVHCTSGKDRTGIVVALVLSLLGVDEEDIVADFAATEIARAGLLEDWRAAHPGRDVEWPGYGRAPADLMRRFLADVTTTYGGVDAYVRQTLGAGDGLQDALRRRLVVAAGG